MIILLLEICINWIFGTSHIDYQAPMTDMNEIDQKFTIHPETGSLKKSSESRIAAPIQSQKVSNNTEMINTPESLRLALGIGTLEPRKTKRALLERLIRIGS